MKLSIEMTKRSDISELISNSLVSIIPNAVHGSFTLTRSLLNDMPESASNDLEKYEGRTITCFAIPIDEDSLWVWHKHGNKRSLLANYVLFLAAQSIINDLSLISIEAQQLTDIVGQKISMVRVGELAGLGKRGWNNLLIHPEYGSWIQIHAIISNADLVGAIEMENDPCIKCGNCVTACPVNAVKPNSFNAIACSSVVASPTRRKSRAIALTENSYIECRECISSCPIGDQPEGIFEWVR